MRYASAGHRRECGREDTSGGYMAFGSSDSFGMAGRRFFFFLGSQAATDLQDTGSP